MEWTEVTVTVNCSYADDAAAVLQMVSTGIYIEDYRNLEENIMEIAHIDLIDDALLQKDRENVIIHAYFPGKEIAEITDFVSERLTALDITFAIETSEISDTDWAESWKKHYKPFAVGKRLIIKPEWENCEPQGRTVLRIEPGLAFGTGTHETTKMCLELLEDYVVEGVRILDVGCGSGILSIAALLLGASSAVAIDIDPVAVKTAKENGELNGFSEETGRSLKVIKGDLTSGLSGGERFGLVLANITAETVTGLLPQLPPYMDDGSVIILSGIIDSKLDIVIKSIEENALAIKETRFENGWAAISAIFTQA